MTLPNATSLDGFVPWRIAIVPPPIGSASTSSLPLSVTRTCTLPALLPLSVSTPAGSFTTDCASTEPAWFSAPLVSEVNGVHSDRHR